MAEPRLSPEAAELLGRVHDLEAQVTQLRREFDYDVERVRETLGQAEVLYRQRVQAEREELEIDREALATWLRMEREALEESERTLATLVADRMAGIDVVARAWADYEVARADATAAWLVSKPHPAPSAASTVRRLGRELGEARRRAESAEWLSEMYEHELDWLSECRQLAGEQDPAAADGDPEAPWLDPDELLHLPRPLRSQLALDRSVRAQTTPWHLARDFERYVAYLRASAGATVTWRRSQGLERDLVARLDGVTEVVHCARAVPPRAVDDRRIGRLHAAVAATRIEGRRRKVTGTLLTTATLSTQAQALAEALHLEVREEMPHPEWPRIKCTVAPRSARRTYVLPLDPGYDDTVVDIGRGDFFALSVAEAEERGFIRPQASEPRAKAA
jgi:hypothetical protein